jgi:hypothetical protein
VQEALNALAAQRPQGVEFRGGFHTLSGDGAAQGSGDADHGGDDGAADSVVAEVKTKAPMSRFAPETMTRCDIRDE